MSSLARASRSWRRRKSSDRQLLIAAEAGRPNKGVDDMHDEQIASSGVPGAGKSPRPAAKANVGQARRLVTLTLTAISLGGGAVAGWGPVPALAERVVQPAANAHSARSVTVRENVTASNVSHRGSSVINDRGAGTGTLSCKVVLGIKLSYTRGNTQFVCSTSAGNVVAGGVANFFASGKTAVFTGTMVVLKGTGKYSHESGHLRVEGTMERKTFYVKVTITGVIAY